jgi:Cu(I)/Ag(I) efflux system membrane protein CusA/SilA
MINRIIDVCAKNKFLVFLFIGVAVVVGWHSLKNTKLDAIPDL